MLGTRAALVLRMLSRNRTYSTGGVRQYPYSLKQACTITSKQTKLCMFGRSDVRHFRPMCNVQSASQGALVSNRVRLCSSINMNM